MAVVKGRRAPAGAITPGFGTPPARRGTAGGGRRGAAGLRLPEPASLPARVPAGQVRRGRGPRPAGDARPEPGALAGSSGPRHVGPRVLGLSCPGRTEAEFGSSV